MSPNALELAPLPNGHPPKGPVVIVVMDGVGIAPAGPGNAVTLARTPTLDTLAASGITSALTAHGTAVGLPSDGDMGNSEVGHNALGAGRVFDQGAKRVEAAINSGELFGHPIWKETLASASGGTLHLIGLLSDGNVHSHDRHLHAMLLAAGRAGIGRVRVHILLDGRDVHPTSALEYVDRLESVLAELGDDYRIGSGGGRMLVTMDRYEADWRIVERGWKAHVQADGRRFKSARQAIETFREEDPGLSDQFLPPFVIDGSQPMADGDGVILFNFRGDRALEITRAFEDGEDFSGFDRGNVPNVKFAGMTRYDGDLGLPKRFLVDPPTIDRTMGEHLAFTGIAQWACSETQKFGHMTYFWNGNRSRAFEPALEDAVEITSDRVPFEERPWMKAAEITDAAIAAVKTGRYGQLRMNYPNGDMVGHTGRLNAAILAVETVDLCLARLAPVVAKAGGVLIVTADHGNCDEMFALDRSGAPKLEPDGTRVISTSHSRNPVPLIISGAPTRSSLSDGGLGNMAATVLDLMGRQAPEDYLPSLLRR
ncbi:MAG: 2,3-bisphosphoglycerate-independent phosphoglycerate mutase [Myxococcota bacterium]|jgi:2,3-bisphosphoglycerate-independent phosphoglycerate mutase